MKYELMLSQKALKDYAESSWPIRYNIMIQYFEETLPDLVDKLSKKLEEEDK